MNSESTVTFSNGFLSFLDDSECLSSFHFSHILSVETYLDSRIVITFKNDTRTSIKFPEETELSVLNKVHRAIVRGGKE